MIFDNYNGIDIEAYTIKDKISVTVLTLGATIVDISVPDKYGNLTHVALSVNDAKTLTTSAGYMGSVVGRCGNRIGNGGFSLNGKHFNLHNNEEHAHLHGGKDGFNKKVYNVVNKTTNSITLSCHSDDGEEGYPGNLDMTVTYTVNNSALSIEYKATCDADTVFNPTNHAYFNLNGQGNGDIHDHEIQIFADNFIAVNKDLLPVAITPVENTPFDFRTAKLIGKDINADNDQLKIAGGYDHNFCLTGQHACTLCSAKSGIVMDVYTDRPGVQFYSGNFIDNLHGKSVYNKRAGLCLETQCYPDAIHHPDYPSVVLNKGQNFYSKTIYEFSVK